MISARAAAPFVVVVACVAALVPLQRWFDAQPVDTKRERDEVYLADGDRVRMLALGYDSLLSDVYWVRAIQFFGRELLTDKTVLNEPNHRLDELYAFTDVATTLDPRSVAPYRFGGYFVHDYADKELGRKLLEKGVKANPQNFRLHQDLAYLSLTDGDCASAARLYDEGSKLEGAPAWMHDMALLVSAHCGRPELAVEMLQRQYEETDDPRVKESLGQQLQGYVALGEVNYLRALVETFRAQTGQLPQSLAQLVTTVPPLPGAPRLRVDADRTPVDPTGVPYAYDRATGAVTTGPGGVALPYLAAYGVSPAGP